jgi:hypothetical protein
VIDLIIIIQDDIREREEGRGDSEQVPGSGTMSRTCSSGQRVAFILIH